MDKKIDEVLKKIEKLEESQSFGSVPRSTGQFLHMLLLATKAKRVLELGCYLGYSTIWMALAAKEHLGLLDAPEDGGGQAVRAVVVHADHLDA